MKRIFRHKRVRAKVTGTKERPRLSVFRSNRGVFVQLIDDTTGSTLVSFHHKKIPPSKNKTDQSFQIGKLLAAEAKKKQISCIVFDRGGYKYHGRVKSLADGAREGGLIF